jgi:hypothetical protein
MGRREYGVCGIPMLSLTLSLILLEAAVLNRKSRAIGCVDNIDFKI